MVIIHIFEATFSSVSLKKTKLFEEKIERSSCHELQWSIIRFLRQSLTTGLEHEKQAD
jgi:hypothetical protein